MNKEEKQKELEEKTKKMVEKLNPYLFIIAVIGCLLIVIWSWCE